MLRSSSRAGGAWSPSEACPLVWDTARRITPVATTASPTAATRTVQPAAGRSRLRIGSRYREPMAVGAVPVRRARPSFKSRMASRRWKPNAGDAGRDQSSPPVLRSRRDASKCSMPQYQSERRTGPSTSAFGFAAAPPLHRRGPAHGCTSAGYAARESARSPGSHAEAYDGRARSRAPSCGHRDTTGGAVREEACPYDTRDGSPPNALIQPRSSSASARSSSRLNVAQCMPLGFSGSSIPSSLPRFLR